jgi:cellulose biosynthesis protein BcsQ
MKTIAIYSNKGGVGKTAAAVNLSYLAAQAGIQTLICDLDPQGSATYYFRIKPRLKRKARGLIKSNKWIDNSIKGTDYENLDLLPADITHRKLDITFDKLKSSTHRLERVIAPFKDEYDLVILDSPSTINLLAENIINAAEQVFVPSPPPSRCGRMSNCWPFAKNKIMTSKKFTPSFRWWTGAKKCTRK